MIGLKDKYSDVFKIGAAVNTWTVDSHAELLKKNFNSITCENEMKFIGVAREKGNYRFEKVDKIYEFAKKNDMIMRGHTLVWHNQTPDWVFETSSKEDLLSYLANHMKILNDRYGDRIDAWDVVNEAIEDKKDVLLRESKWKDIIGTDYMDTVFLLAKEIMPGKTLFYNDYNETNPVKRKKIYDTIKGMLDRGIPVSGIGLQCHFTIADPTMEELKKTLDLFSGLGLTIHITEMDISLYDFADRSIVKNPSYEVIKKQEDMFAESFRLFREYKQLVESVTLWGVADDVTWLDYFPVENRKNWPLLFDENHKPKEALLRIMDF